MKQVKITKLNKIEHDSKRYDIEVKNVHNFFANGILVHNSFVAMGFGKGFGKGNDWVVHSKGLGHRGIAFQLKDASLLISIKKHVQSVIQSVYNKVMNVIDPKPYSNRRPLFKKSDDEAADNVYVKMFYSTIKPIFDKMKQDRYVVDYADVFDPHDAPSVYETGIYLLGEIFGKSIQGGYDYGTSQPEFRCFDIYVGVPGSKGRYLDYDEYVKVCKDYGIPMVPVIYRGPFSSESILKWTDGKETISGKGVHIREGCVIKPIEERHHSGLGRVMLKSVSAAYALKASGEEFQ